MVWPIREFLGSTMYPLDDTIAAIASAPGGAARGILRLSGPAAWQTVAAHFHTEQSLDLSKITRPTAIDGALRLACCASDMPCSLYLWPEGRSYTGQRVAEIHTLGCPPLLEAILREVCGSGARLAERGEFTLRAFLAGRIDLTQAEAVLGVIDANSADQLQVALAQLAGGLAGPLGRLREALLDLLAHLEAGFDFADEDLPFIGPEELVRQLAEAAGEVHRLSQQMRLRGEVPASFRAALVGSPNAGKSSLFNALIGGPGALVSHEPGTTRDYLVAELDLDGLKCQLVDTAGIQPEETLMAGSIGQAAEMISVEQHRQADLRVLCLEANQTLKDWQREQLARAAGRGALIVWTKMDLADGTFDAYPPEAVPTSAVTGQGIEQLRQSLRAAAMQGAGEGAEVLASTSARCRESVRLAAEGLERAQQLAASGSGEELIATEVRIVLNELGKVVGAVYTDDVLDRIFSRFCIGK